MEVANYQHIYEKLPVCVLGCNTDGIVFYTNTKAKLLLGNLLKINIDTLNCFTYKQEPIKNFTHFVNVQNYENNPVLTILRSPDNLFVFEISVNYTADKVFFVILLNRTVQENLNSLLIASNKRFEDYTLNLSDKIWELDVNGTVVYTSAEFHPLLEYSRNEVIGTKFFNYLYTPFVASISEKFKEANQTLKPLKDIEIYLRSKSGSLVQLQVSVFPLISVDGQLTGCRVINFDMAERTMLQKKLEKRYLYEKMLNRIINLSVSVSNLNDFLKQTVQILKAKTNFNRVVYIKYAPTEALFKPEFESYDTKVRGLMQNTGNVEVNLIPTVFNLLSHGHTVVFNNLSALQQNSELEFYSRMGVKSLINVPVYTENQFYGFYAFNHFENELNWEAEDINLLESIALITVKLIQKIKESEALKTSESKYRCLTENMPDALMLINANYQIEYVNSTLFTFYNQSDDLIGKSIFELKLNSVNLQLLSENIKAVLSLNTTATFELESFFDSQKKYYSVIINKQISENSESDSVICLFHDITDVRISQINLLNVNSLKDKLFSVIGHDLKSVTATIIGISSLLNENITNYNFDKLKQFATIINTSGNNLMNLLDNLIDWALAQDKTVNIFPEQILASKLINKCLEYFDTTLAQKQITVSFNVNIQHTLYADARMIETALRNLVANAIKYSYSGGKLLIKSETIDNTTQISVIDYGVGMSTKQIEGLFSNVKNTSTYGTQNEKGTGLGLQICKDFLERNNGLLQIYSVLGEGSEFRMVIPSKKSE